MPLVIPSVNAPGVQIFEDSAGYIPVAIATHSAVYMIGSSANGAKNVATQVVDPTDFTNQFGASPSLDFVKLYFANDPSGQLFFVRVDNAAANPTATEYTATIGAAFNEEMPQGFLIAPQAFAQLSNQSDRTSVALAMRDLCQNNDFHWYAIIDASLAANDVTLLTSEVSNYQSPRGHCGYYTPWLVTLDNKTVPPSAAVAGVATRRYREQGFYQSPAGKKYALRGVKDVSVQLKRQHQETLNPLGVNVIRKFSDGLIAVWGSRNRSVDDNFRFVSDRVIFNVINRTLREAFDVLTFDQVDGQGILFQQIKDTAELILYRIWQAGALYGSTAARSFIVICDETNNPALDLTNGNVKFDVYAVTSPPAEKIIGRLVKYPIGSFDAQVR